MLLKEYDGTIGAGVPLDKPSVAVAQSLSADKKDSTSTQEGGRTNEACAVSLSRVNDWPG